MANQLHLNVGTKCLSGKNCIILPWYLYFVVLNNGLHCQDIYLLGYVKLSFEWHLSNLNVIVLEEKIMTVELGESRLWSQLGYSIPGVRFTKQQAALGVVFKSTRLGKTSS